MKIFDLRQQGCAVHTKAMLKDAMDCSASGGQALLLHSWGLQMEPRCFHGASYIGKLLDQDATRLETMAKRLGVRVISICRSGMPGQHIDLVGKPLQKAMQAMQTHDLT